MRIIFVRLLTFTRAESIVKAIDPTVAHRETNRPIDTAGGR